MLPEFNEMADAFENPCVKDPVTRKSLRAFLASLKRFSRLKMILYPYASGSFSQSTDLVFFAYHMDMGSECFPARRVNAFQSEWRTQTLRTILLGLVE